MPNCSELNLIFLINEAQSSLLNVLHNFKTFCVKEEFVLIWAASTMQCGDTIPITWNYWSGSEKGLRRDSSPQVAPPYDLKSNAVPIQLQPMLREQGEILLIIPNRKMQDVPCIAVLIESSKSAPSMFWSALAEPLYLSDEKSTTVEQW